MKSKKLAIVQSNYIPWKGYFDLINMVDEFIIFDDVQYDKHGWRNRNKIKTPNGTLWLTIPVLTKGKNKPLIYEVKIDNKKHWAQKHWASILQNYSKAKYFKDYKEIFENLYLTSNEEYLSHINYKFILLINQILGIKTKISLSSNYKLVGEKTKKLINLCKQCCADEYISGPLAKNYIEEVLFYKENIKLTWIDYSGYSEYNQLYPRFEHAVSIIDLIFNEGHNATHFMKSFKP